MAQITIKQLLEAGVHFGHQTQRWNPKMKKFIFGERNGIYIINLEITLTCLEKALGFLKKVASDGKEILLVGTKRQAQDPLREASEKCGMPYVEQRWLGGMLTNFETVRKSVARLDYIDKTEQEGGFQFVTKKEAGMLVKEREKLLKNLRGVRHMKRLPAAIFVIDSKKEEIAIKEAQKLGIPVVAVLDTNGDPDMVDYPMPGNDDAIRAIKLFSDVVADTINEGRIQYQQGVDQAAAAKDTEEEEVLAAVPATGEQDQTASGSEEVHELVEEKLVAKFVDPSILKTPEEKVKIKKPLRKETGRGAKIK